MDKMLYIAMSGAKENFHGIAIHGNNLANASTTGFKADLEQARAMEVLGDGHRSRVFSMTERPGYNLEAGALTTTGRDLDIAVNGEGYIAITDSNGNEAYTRNGSLNIDVDGILRTDRGQAVLDQNGAEIVLPIPLRAVSINADGVISGTPEGAEANVVEEFGQIKLVTIPRENVEKGTDGLFRNKDKLTGRYLDPGINEFVQLKSGALENSNVNVVGEMTNLIRLQRQFDMHMKMMETAKEMDESQTMLLRMQ